MTGMQVGVAVFATDESSDIRDVARAAEDAGFESLWVPEHTHIPTSRETPYPMGGELPPEYCRVLDPFVTLMAAASVTERLKVGTGVCLVVEHDPIVLAKQVATLDLLSGGRFLFGVGCGWNAEEMRDHGTDPDRRWSVLRDRVGAMRVLWTQDVASYDGPHASFGPTWQWPKPVQQPYPPVLVGGGTPGAMRHAARWGDGWLPMPDRSKGSIGERIKQLATVAEECGRPTPPVTVYGARAEKQVLHHYAEAGVERCVLMLPPTTAAVETVAKHAREVLAQ